MSYTSIIQPGQTFLQRWQAIDSKFETSIETIDIDLATSKLKIYKFDGTSVLSTNAIPYPVASASNGLIKVGTDILLGGNLAAGTTINTSTFNLLIQNGIGAQRLRITPLFTELAGDLELRIQPPSIQAATAIDGQFLKLIDENTGECDYDYIKSSDLDSLSIIGNKVRLTFKDLSYIESGLITFPTKSHGSFTKNNITTSTIALVNVFTPILGSTTAGTLVDFTHNGLGRLTYTGATTKLFKITRISSMREASNSRDIQTQFYKNLAPIGVLQQERLISQNVLQNRTMIAEVSLSNGDFIELNAASISGSLNLIEQYCTCIIEEI